MESMLAEPSCSGHKKTSQGEVETVRTMLLARPFSDRRRRIKAPERAGNISSVRIKLKEELLDL